MADKNERDFEVAVTLGDTDVTIFIRSNEVVRERAGDMFKQLCVMRGIPKPESITIRDDEIRRILKKKGVDPNNPKSGTLTRMKINGTIRAVQGFHTDNRTRTFVQAFGVAGMEDMFQKSSDGKLLPKLRPDVAKIVPLEVIERLKAEHFAEPDMDEDLLSMSPDPALIDPSVPLEHMIVLTRAIAELFPDIEDQLNRVREHMGNAEAEEGGVETDPNGFQSTELD